MLTGRRVTPAPGATTCTVANAATKPRAETVNVTTLTVS